MKTAKTLMAGILVAAAAAAFGGALPQAPASLPALTAEQVPHGCLAFAFGVTMATAASEDGGATHVDAGLAGFSGGEIGAELADLSGGQLAALFAGGVAMVRAPQSNPELDLDARARALLGASPDDDHAWTYAATQLAIACSAHMDVVGLSWVMHRGLDWWQRASAVGL